MRPSAVIRVIAADSLFPFSPKSDCYRNGSSIEYRYPKKAVSDFVIRGWCRLVGLLSWRRNVWRFLSAFPLLFGSFLRSLPGRYATAQIAAQSTTRRCGDTGCRVKVTQTATGAVRTVLSSEDGRYVFPTLALGPYMLEGSKAGFKTYNPDRHRATGG